MSDVISPPTPVRKVLSLRKELQEAQTEPRFVLKEESVYMVWRDGGDMPARVYRPTEKNLAVKHAKMLTESVGQRFHVLRSYRAFDPLPE